MKYYIKTFQLDKINIDVLKNYILENKKYFENENATKVLLAPWWITDAKNNEQEIKNYINKKYEIWSVEPSELQTKFSKNCFNIETCNIYRFDIGV